MAKFTPKTINDMHYSIAEQVITRVNTSVSFYLKRPSTINLNQVEDTLLDTMPFAELITNSELGQQLFKETTALLNNVQCLCTASLLNESAILNLSTNEA